MTASQFAALVEGRAVGRNRFRARCRLTVTIRLA